MKQPAPLSSGRDFRRVMSAGVTRRVGWATIHVAAAPEPSAPSRVGLAVATTAGGAVQRNRIKRRLRAAFRSCGPATGVDVVIRARAEAATVEFQELEETFQELGA